MTPLHRAARTADHYMVQALLDRNANPDALTWRHRAPGNVSALHNLAEADQRHMYWRDVRLTCGAVVTDRVNYAAAEGWPGMFGASMSLSPFRTSAEQNDDSTKHDDWR